MTGYEEAAAWLAAWMPDWTIVRGEARLVPGMRAGAPTETVVEVVLGRIPRVNEVTGIVDYGDVTLTGGGTSYLEAVHRAVGGPK
jgi:hypothetical protein